MPVLLILLVDSLLCLAAGLFAYRGQVNLCLSILAATALLIAWQWILLDLLRTTNQTIRIENGVRRPHYVQAMLVFCIYSYWSLYWDEVGKYAPLIIVQLIFTYAFEMLLSWSKYKVWRIGFGPIPIVFSVNLFLWFNEDWYVFQFVLLMLTYIGRECLRWNRDGRNTHIFNPTGFSLATVCVVLMITGAVDVTRGVDIVGSFELPPNFFEVLFLLSLVVQFLFRTTLITMGAMLTLYLLYLLSIVVFGAPITSVPIPHSVFVGLTFLVTDPSTSPKTNVGKLLFGAAYGGGVFFAYIGLRMMHQPAFFDKILLVPVVNLLAPFFDRIGAAIHRRIERARWSSVFISERYASLLLCLVIFLGILPSLKTPNQTPKPEFISQASVSLSPSVDQLWENMMYCREVLPKPYRPFGFRSEIAEYQRIRDIYQSSNENRPE